MKTSQILPQISNSLWCLITVFQIGLNEEITQSSAEMKAIHVGFFFVYLVFSERKFKGNTWTANYLFSISKKQILWKPWKVCESLDIFFWSCLAQRKLLWPRKHYIGRRRFTMSEKSFWKSHSYLYVPRQTPAQDIYKTFILW